MMIIVIIIILIRSDDAVMQDIFLCMFCYLTLSEIIRLHTYLRGSKERNDDVDNDYGVEK